MEEWRRLHPVKTAQCVAERIKAPPRTVEKWMAGEARPSFDWFGPILCAYGLSFVAAGMRHPAPWLDDAVRAERRAQLQAMSESIEAEMAAFADRRRA